MKGAGDGRGRGALWICLFLILVATLTPGQWSETEGRPRGQGGGVVDGLLNIALFAPFGAALGRHGRSASRAVLIGVLLSSGIEIAQLGIPGRVTSLFDVVTNAAGTLAGWVLCLTAPAWVRPDPRAASRLSLAAACVATAVLGATGLLLEPAFPATVYFGGWTPEFGHLRLYHGRVLEASLGGEAIPPGRIPDSAGLRSRLVKGETLRVRAETGSPSCGLAPILSIHDDLHQEILLLGPDRRDLVYRFRTRAAALEFDSPELRVPGAMRDLRAGEPLVVVVARGRRGYCIEVNRIATSGLGYTAGMGWAFLLYGQGLPAWTHEFLNVLWMAGLALPVGYWARARWECYLAVPLLAASILLLPLFTGLVRTPPGELAAAAAGLFVGALLRLHLAEQASNRNDATHGRPT